MKARDWLVGGLAVVGAWSLVRRVAGAASPCPEATQDLAVNTRNRQIAIERYDYGPLNPAEPSLSFWRRLAARWSKGPPTDADVREAQSARCGNCGVFDVSPGMQACLPPINLADDYDKAAMESRAVLGYCWAHHFKCASTRTCATWITGGPIRDDARSPLRKRRPGA